MQYRKLGKTDFKVSTIGLGTWQVGGKWGSDFSHKNADAILGAAIDAGVNFIDTADVYGGGESEKAVGRLLKNRQEELYIATKCGRRLNPHTNDAYQPEALRTFVEDSLRNMQLETIDLIQLHCPPTEVYYRPEIFGLFDDLKKEGKIQHLGVSIEKVEEGLKAIEYDNVTTVQLIFNMFRHRPADLLFREAHARNVGLIVRVPLASGLLTGKFTQQTTFAEGDHRNFNRDGAAFDKGETFSGVPYEVGLEAVRSLQKELSRPEPLVQLALRWVMMFDEVSTVIPGASSNKQLASNVQAVDIPALNQMEMATVRSVYDKFIRPHVHHSW